MTEDNKAKEISARAKAVLCAEGVTAHKAQDLVILDVSKLSSFADFFVICSGKSSRQVQGIADNLETGLRNQGLRPAGIEGSREGHWILMDYGDVIVHIFYEPVRLFYDLESLWSEAKRLDFEQESAVSESNTV
jgi:ribosome-associated protein